MTSSGPRWLLALTLLSVAAAAQEQKRPDPREVARQVHDEGGYAEELRLRDGDGSLISFPFGGGGDGHGGRRFDVGGGGDARSDRIAGRGGEASTPPPSLPTFGGSLFSGRAVSTVLLVGVILLLLGLAVAVAYALSRRAPAPPVRRPAPRAGPSPAPAELTSEDADPDALAAEGRYAEAIAALLARSLRAVGWRPTQERSRTAREVLAGLPSTDPRRAPLRRIVTLGERVRFAGDAATAALYAETKRWYEALTEGGAGA